MDRRSLLQGLLALPLGSILRRCSSEAKTHKGPSTLKVALDGAFAIVLQPDRNWGVRAFTQRDPNHELYFLGDKVDHHFRASLEKQRFSFTLQPNGLQQSVKRPELDPGLPCEFNVETDFWCQEDYHVTIDLPAPSRITFTPPVRPALVNGRKICLPFNHVLEYEAADPSLLRMLWQEKTQLFRPMTCEQLIARYRAGCEELQREYDKNNGRQDQKHEMPGVCSNPGDSYKSFCQSGDLTFFFGVGLPAGSSDLDHPIRFFNQLIQTSFPHLQDLRIQSIGPPGSCENTGCNDSRVRPQASLQNKKQGGQLIEVSSIVDCHVTGPIVTFPAL